MAIGIWDAPPLEKTPEELEKERRYREAVQFGADYDRDPNRMLQKLQQQRRSRDVMGQIDPLTQEIIREQEDKSSGAYLDRPYTPGQRAPVPDNSPPPEVGPASPQRVNGPRALRAIMPPGEEPPMARANVPGVKFQTNAPLNDEGVAELDQQVMDGQMEQAAKSNAMRAKVADAMAQRRAANPKQPTLHRVNYMAARGLNPDKTTMEQPIHVPGNEVGANMLSSILRSRAGRPDPWSDQATQNRIAVKNAEGGNRQAVAEIGAGARKYAADKGLEEKVVGADASIANAKIRTVSAEKIASWKIDSDEDMDKLNRELTKEVAKIHEDARNGRASKHEIAETHRSLEATKQRYEGMLKGQPEGTFVQNKTRQKILDSIAGIQVEIDELKGLQ